MPFGYGIGPLVEQMERNKNIFKFLSQKCASIRPEPTFLYSRGLKVWDGRLARLLSSTR